MSLFIYQIIIVSGESGSGKTEVVHQCLDYIVRSVVTSSTDPLLTQKIHFSAVVLEAFCNAKTLLNDNSSRFQSLTSIYVPRKGFVSSLRITGFLIDRSRLTSQNYDERNFHIFYQVRHCIIQYLVL